MQLVVFSHHTHTHTHTHTHKHTHTHTHTHTHIYIYIYIYVYVYLLMPHFTLIHFRLIHIFTELPSNSHNLEKSVSNSLPVSPIGTPSGCLHQIPPSALNYPPKADLSGGGRGLEMWYEMEPVKGKHSWNVMLLTPKIVSTLKAYRGKTASLFVFEKDVNLFFIKGLEKCFCNSWNSCESDICNSGRRLSLRGHSWF